MCKQANNIVKYRLQAPAIPASCDRLKNCWIQTTESCFSAGSVIHHVLLFQPYWSTDDDHQLTFGLLSQFRHIF